MKVDIICPLYNAKEYVERLKLSLEKQKNVEIENVRFIMTEGNDNTETILKQMQKNNNKIIYKKIKKENFSHSLTREKEAFESNADILVFITQDIIIEKDNWLYNLIKPIIDKEVDACYSRQICRDRSSIEYYTRQQNYPNNSKIKSKEDIKTLGLKTFFFSDASSAVKRETFLKLNGYDGKDFPTNEDMYIAYKLITNGYKIKYCADSEVIHSHNFTLKQQYKRYYDTGRFFKQNEYLNNYKVNTAGGSLAKYVLKSAINDKNWKVIFEFLPNMASRFLGMKVGKSSRR